ncbi:hypothetical protein HHK36_030910 [Tetracentron sinense]|uniref:Cyclin-dependent kinase inhibitor domain-containing protein n=1 Tax=Tetracentron sinense TaxID=13715 RepID=A0A834Y8F9_TETSI|nr:hypothetical protein HHK36_030910 [Tetracentron sinense]
MRKYMKKYRGIVEVPVMEVGQVGVRTRARALAMAEANTDTVKRRKIDSGELDLSASYVQLRSRGQLVITPEKTISSAMSENSGRVITDDRCSSSTSENVPASECSSNGSSEFVKDSMRSADLEGDDFEIENPTSSDCRERREMTPSSDVRAESDQLESMERHSEANSVRTSTAKEMPSAAEIAEFFEAAEKDEQKRFAEKYNYDFEKNVPLAGRYEWVRLKP